MIKIVKHETNEVILEAPGGWPHPLLCQLGATGVFVADIDGYPEIFRLKKVFDAMTKIDSSGTSSVHRVDVLVDGRMVLYGGRFARVEHGFSKFNDELQPTRATFAFGITGGTTPKDP